MKPTKTPSSARKPKPSRKQQSSALLSTPLAILAAAVGGCVSIAAFPDTNLFPLAWFGLAGLILAIRGRGFAGAFLLGLISGFFENLGGFYWISNMLQSFAHMEVWSSWVVTCLLILVQGLVYAFSAGAAAGIIKRIPSLPWILVFPIIFTAIEYAAPLIFPWYQGNGQQRFTAIVQIADITGVSGITFLIILVNCAIAEILVSRISKTPFPKFAVLIAASAFFAVTIYGLTRINVIEKRMAEAPKFKVGIVEADIGIWEKEAQNADGSQMDAADQMTMLYSNLLKHQYLSQLIEKESHPDLIVWPESSYFPLYRVFTRRTANQALAVSFGGNIYGIGEGGVSLEKGTADPAPSVFKNSGLSAIAAMNEENIIAAGPRGAAYHFDGRAWTRESTDTDRNLNAVAWAHDSEEAIAVGDNGVVMFRLDGKWKTMDTGRFNTLRGAVSTPDFGWVVCGDKGTLFSIKGGKIKDLAPEGLPDLSAVAWSAESGLVAAGHSGTIVKVANATEVRTEQPTKRTLRSISAGPITWAVGDDGEVIRCQETCKRVPAGVRRNLTSVVSDSTGHAWAAGEDGLVVELFPEDNRAPKLLEGAEGRLTGLTEIPFKEGYPYPLDAKKIYVSKAPLPEEGSYKNTLPAYKKDRNTPQMDRNSVMRGFSTPLIFGAATMERFPPEGKEAIKHNSAVMIDGQGKVLGTYFKNRLLVFGEYIPFEKWFPFFRKWFPEAGDWTPGTEPMIFKLKDARIGISICYEGIIPSFHRRLAELQPNILVNITNDAWFGKTAEPWLHFQLSQLRAVEARSYMVRSTNTGISAIVDPLGRIVSHTEINDAEYLVEDVALTNEATLYIRYGDVFALACCGLSLLFIGIAMVARRKR